MKQAFSFYIFPSYGMWTIPQFSLNEIDIYLSSLNWELKLKQIIKNNQLLIRNENFFEFGLNVI